jgi:hypothetical protein
MKKSIYDVYVTVTSQEQADRLKGICIEYGLPIWDSSCAFDIFPDDVNPILSYNGDEFFIIDLSNCESDDLILNFTKITESEFEQLAKEFKQ